MIYNNQHFHRTYHEGQCHAPLATCLHECKQPSTCTEQHQWLK